MFMYHMILFLQKSYHNMFLLMHGKSYVVSIKTMFRYAVTVLCCHLNLAAQEAEKPFLPGKAILPLDLRCRL